jgi:Circadian oscillating protein COP23
MKQRNLIKSVTVGLVLGAAINITPPITAQQRPVGEYFCGNDNDGPATMIQLSEGSLPVISWIRDFAPDSEWTPIRRCQQVSLKFKQNQESNNLRYVVPGISAVNGLPVLCASPARVSSNNSITCPNAQILMTLREGDRVQDYIDQIANINTGNTKEPIKHSSPVFVCAPDVQILDQGGTKICPYDAVRGINMQLLINEKSSSCLPGVLRTCQ